jgi:S-adenosylmethionine:tRNA ribosyltransferase-isomerase
LQTAPCIFDAPDNLATLAVLRRKCILAGARFKYPIEHPYSSRMYSLSDFDFDLPQELIAQTPLPERSASRLLQVKPDGGLVDRAFGDIAGLLQSGDLLVFNDTRVLKARFFGVKETGGKVEVMVERVLDARNVHAQIRASKSPTPGMKIRLADAFDVIVGQRAGEFYELQFPGDVFELIEAHGRLPLPPYIEHDADAYDETRYQTVYAKNPGAVAAPTAGLHFDEALLAKLKAKGVNFAYVTLHVGAGTFQPVRNENLAEHKMHSEWYTISQETVDAVKAAQAAGRDVIAVGTTSLRALESASQSGVLRAGSDDTQLFITPGYTFKTVTRLITNFHLPKSTLLMLVSALAGYDTIRAAYRHAIAQRYRFFSYGDAMFLTTIKPAESKAESPC